MSVDAKRASRRPPDSPMLPDGSSPEASGDSPSASPDAGGVESCAGGGSPVMDPGPERVTPPPTLGVAMWLAPGDTAASAASDVSSPSTGRASGLLVLPTSSSSGAASSRRFTSAPVGESPPARALLGFWGSGGSISWSGSDTAAAPTAAPTAARVAADGTAFGEPFAGGGSLPAARTSAGTAATGGDGSGGAPGEGAGRTPGGGFEGSREGESDCSWPYEAPSGGGAAPGVTCVSAGDWGGLAMGLSYGPTLVPSAACTQYAVPSEAIFMTAVVGCPLTSIVTTLSCGRRTFTFPKRTMNGLECRVPSACWMTMMSLALLVMSSELKA
mmetsp:Transcript_4233/g.13541  ORF Transcript_4233/g.13541 Transcript_4233/m.13541 type:complete len:329 (-) Transcript_4233:516-1502(-)